MEHAPHRFGLRVYYEDTDLAGIVYYANYLKFIERARTEALIGLGIDQATLKAATGIVFAVARLEIDYRAPARFQDRLEVTTAAERITGARADLNQCVWRGATLLVAARVRIVALDAAGRAARLPADVRAALAHLVVAP
jgi:acyl-CoA thioester hydrolase